MFGPLLQRMRDSLIVVMLMSAIAFTGIHLIGDPIHLLVSPNASTEEVDAAARSLGLDRPVYEQYALFVKHAAEGDLGRSFVFNRPALAIVLERMPATLEMAFVALVLALAIGIPLGLVAGLMPHSWAHKLIAGFSVAGVTIPTFWKGLILILIFSVNLGWLPSGGRGDTEQLFGIAFSFMTWDGLKHMILPAMTLAIFQISMVIRLTETGTRDVVQQEYVRFARAKGVSGLRLLARHIAPNVMIPVVTAVGLEFGHLIAFSVVTESVFAWPGMGKLIIDSILHLDRPVVVAYLMVTVLLVVSINLVVDLLYVILDPRLRARSK
ncbi:ABC transporter permease [Polaromonas sp. JS666]|uniref:ABC transporter permease n=1 Tax=Polaromonas sp. (strain JS666 / ATCC BAA-500) TaxID=296591 RepID=UPI00088D6D30|nr:ABC transporter permease [Polaromonas sp. JS666]SDN89809.1 peptide/nickel transport system permease protein [Polaromonas sp. JS666]